MFKRKPKDGGSIHNMQIVQLLLINLCLHPGCDGTTANIRKPGYCHKHYQRARKHGSSYAQKTSRGALVQGPYSTLFIMQRRSTQYWGTQVEGKPTLVHRLILSIRLGRPLTQDEQVHHEDGDGLNNSPENLSLHTASAHGKISVERRKAKNVEPF